MKKNSTRFAVNKGYISLFSSAAGSKKVGEGVPYKTVLKDGSLQQQDIPESADVVILGKKKRELNQSWFLIFNYELMIYFSMNIIGGGSIGCNTLYHLTKLGLTNVVLLERNRLTSGTTWHTGILFIM